MRSICIAPRPCFRKGHFHLVVIALEQTLCPVNWSTCRLTPDLRGLQGREGDSESKLLWTLARQWPHWNEDFLLLIQDGFSHSSQTCPAV